MDENKLDAVPDREFIFGSLFNIANRLQTLLDRELEEFGVTAKQWFMTIMLGSLFESPPTLGEVAAALGSTHQNAKQVAMRLEARGFLRIQDDAHDGRAVRLVLTDECRAFWAAIQARGDSFMSDTYAGLSGGEMAMLRKSLDTVMTNIETMDKRK